MEITLNIDGPLSPERTREAARLAAEAIRYLNHATGRHRGGALEWASDADAVTGSLATMAMRLPQLLDQLGGWLAGECAAGHLRVAYGPYQGDGPAAVAEVRRLYQDAETAANALYAALNAAAQVTAAIGGYPQDDDAGGRDD